MLEIKQGRLTRLSVLLLALLCPLPGWAEKVATTPRPTGYVDDYAGVLSEPGRSEIEVICRQVHERTRAQVFVVTVHKLEGEPVEKFANELFAKWKIGEKKTDRGVLMLFAIDDRRRWIEVGYGLEGELNDAKVGDIGREMVAPLRNKDYDRAVGIGVREIASVIAAASGVTLDSSARSSGEGLGETAPPGPRGPPRSSAALAGTEAIPWTASGGFLLFFFVFLFFFFFFLVVIVAIVRGVKGRGSGAETGRGGAAGTGSDFSSSSDSSSSDSFSGGDGGSSGGGGAGGDW